MEKEASDPEGNREMGTPAMLAEREAGMGRGLEYVADWVGLWLHVI